MERHYTYPVTGNYHITIQYMNEGGSMVSENYYRNELRIKIDKQLVEVKKLSEPPLFVPEDKMTPVLTDDNMTFSFPSSSFNLIPEVLKSFKNPTKRHSTDLVISIDEYLNYHLSVSGFISNGETLNLSFADKIMLDRKDKPHITLIAILNKAEVPN